MMVRLHTGSWFTERIIASGACCALSSVFVFHSQFDETRSLREISRMGGKALFTDNYRHFNHFFATFPINFSYCFAPSEYSETGSTVVNILNAFLKRYANVLAQRESKGKENKAMRRIHRIKSVLEVKISKINN
jgi:hypothetical protein